LLEIVAEVSHNMIALCYLFEELVLATEVVYVGLFGFAELLGGVLAAYELVLEAVDCPADVGGQCAVKAAICRFGFPDKLGFVGE
jgi:hypothetical protein